ncbi:MAG: hypothetical protein LYZ66_02820 [Nitrososphaerales archaeon]|nr:hypothetical protein [Nitrososphaerales archaeon]
MGKGQPKKGRPKIRRIATPKTTGAKIPLSTSEEWLRLQPVKPGATKPVVKVPRILTRSGYANESKERQNPKIEVTHS